MTVDCTVFKRSLLTIYGVIVVVIVVTVILVGAVERVPVTALSPVVGTQKPRIRIIVSVEKDVEVRESTRGFCAGNLEDASIGELECGGGTLFGGECEAIQIIGNPVIWRD